MIALDIETSGTNPGVHGILAIGAVDIENPSDQFYGECRLFEGGKIEEAALAVNGFTKEECMDSSKQSEAELVQGFFAWAFAAHREHTLVAQNVWFDAGFLEAAAARAKTEYPFAKRVLDLHSLAWLHMKLHAVEPPLENQHSGISSGVLLRYCGLPEEERPHNALTGALWHAEALSRMAYTKNLLPEFSTFPLPWTTS